MNRPIFKLHEHRHLITSLILLIGLGSAILIYHGAQNSPEAVLGYSVEGGEAFPVIPETSKAYSHDLELYGGKMNLLADAFHRWFAGLGHGRSLAYTVALLTVLVAAGFFLAAGHAEDETGR